jgi:hypothetical protein
MKAKLFGNSVDEILGCTVGTLDAKEVLGRK